MGTLVYSIGVGYNGIKALIKYSTVHDSMKDK